MEKNNKILILHIWFHSMQFETMATATSGYLDVWIIEFFPVCIHPY